MREAVKKNKPEKSCHAVVGLCLRTVGHKGKCSALTRWEKRVLKAARRLRNSSNYGGYFEEKRNVERAVFS